MDVRGVQEMSFTKLGRILKVPDFGILGGGVSPSLAGNEGTITINENWIDLGQMKLSFKKSGVAKYPMDGFWVVLML